MKGGQEVRQRKHDCTERLEEGDNRRQDNRRILTNLKDTTRRDVDLA